MAKLSVAIVAHPHKRAAAGALWERTLGRLEACAEVRALLLTRGGRGDGAAIADMIGAIAPDVVIAAGGDGTVGAVVHELCARSAEPTPALAILALGTANNFARTLGLPSYRQAGERAVDAAVAAIAADRRRRVDVGHAAGRYFAGSFTLGLDAEVLALRNRLRQRLRLRDPLAGYPLYLWSCAVSMLRQRALMAQVEVDGRAAECSIFNLLVTNAPLYAGEFRFDGEARLADGCLDVQLFADRGEYLSGYVAAWRRHLRHRAGRRVVAPRRLQRVRQIRVVLPAALPGQIDGEMGEARRDFAIGVAPGRLEVCVPADALPV